LRFFARSLRSIAGSLRSFARSLRSIDGSLRSFARFCGPSLGSCVLCSMVVLRPETTLPRPYLLRSVLAVLSWVVVLLGGSTSLLDLSTTRPFSTRNKTTSDANTLP
jgi:hypothetical protein